MRKWHTLQLVISCGLLGLFACQGPDCSDRRRWNVKTLTDTGEKQINFAAADTALKDLIHQFPHTEITDSTVRTGIEFRTYRVLCRIRKFKKNSDGDLHLFLEDPGDPSKTMIAEIPDCDCDCGAAAQSKYAETFRKARTDLESFIEEDHKLQPGIYEITGVAFFDDVHGQKGGSISGIELHPVLSIQKK